MYQNDHIPIPQPTPSFLLGNLRDVDPTDAPGSFDRLAEIYGEIFQLDIAGRKTIVCSSYETINDLCDATRFEKPVQGALEEVRVLAGDGLFTAYPNEKASDEHVCSITYATLSKYVGLGCSTPIVNADIWTTRHSQGNFFTSDAFRTDESQMFDPMMDCATQMVLQWDRFGPSHEIVCADDFIRYTVIKYAA